MSAAPRTYLGELAKLDRLETFDPAAFTASDKATQDVAEFVLVLALAFNDLKDLLLAESLLLTQKPSDLQTPTPALGMFSGAHYHFYRLLLAHLYELLYLVQQNATIRATPPFLKLEKQLTRGARESWGKLVAAAEEKNAEDSDIRFLLLARNKVAFHYDRKVIGRAFRAAFDSSGARLPYLSRGRSVASARFYFADAAAQTYLQQQFGEIELEQFFLRRWDLLTNIGHALHALVTTFVNSRGFAWRETAV